jgi:CheY-like chemotaxis protein
MSPRTLDVDVLVVDDDAAVRTSTGEVIASCGYSVMEAVDGQEALELLGELAVGIMILDIQMPRLSGLALLDQLDDPPPVVLLSAFESPETDDRHDANVVRHLHKPAAPDDLLVTIAGAIGPPHQASAI